MMVYGKKAIIFIIISVFFTMGITAKENNQSDAEPLIRAFESSGAELEAYWLNVGTKYQQVYENDRQLLDIGNRLSAAFNLPEADQLINEGEKGYFATKGTWGNGTEVELLLKRQSSHSKELYFIFRMYGTTDLESLSEHYTTLSLKLQENHITPKINSCIRGNISDKLDDVEQFVLLKDILHNLNAVEVERLDTELVKSISAYSGDFGNLIWTGNQKMNLQIATHVDSIQKKTILTLGTPIITIEY